MTILRHKKRPFVVLLVPISMIFLLLFFFLNNSQTLFAQVDDSDELYCHGVTFARSLPNIADHPPTIHKRNIFFLETSCNSYKKGKLFIKARQACAVESAARMNPNMDIHLLYASPGVIKDDGTESDRILKMLTTYPNIKLLHFDVEKYVKDTPVETLWSTEKIKTSLYPLAHTSDILRLVTLYKYGGIYLDLDVIVIKSLQDFPENFAGAESDTLIANGVMGFSKHGKGREYINECLDDISQHFNGQEWSYNGPQLITRNIFHHCSQFDPQAVIRFGSCEDFTIFPPSAFYLIPYAKWEWFFKDKLANMLEGYIEEQSYLIHVWNKFSFSKNISKSDLDVPYLRMASKYCPGVVQELDEVF